jgi:hypothetical protein
MEGHTKVLMDRIPDCDIDPSHGPAYADAKLSIGPWGYVCRSCFSKYGCKLGLGQGQELIPRSTDGSTTTDK